MYGSCLKTTSAALLLFGALRSAAQIPPQSDSSGMFSRIATMNEQGRSLLKKQRYSQGIALLQDARGLAAVYGSDSLTAGTLTLLGAGLLYISAFDSARRYLEEARDMAAKKKYYTPLAAADLQLYGYYLRTGKPDSAAILSDRLLTMTPLLDSNGPERARIEMYANQIARHRVKYNESLEHCYRAIRIFARLHDTVNVANMDANIAMTMSELNQPEKALGYYRESGELLTLLGRTFDLANQQLNMSEMFFLLKQYDSSELYARRALKNAVDLNDKRFQAYAYMHLGDAYGQRQQYREAEKYFLRSIDLADTALNGQIAGSYLGLGQMYMHSGEAARASVYLERFLAMASKIDYREQIIEAYADLARNEHTLHHDAKAFDYQKLYAALKDSAYTESVSRASVEMESKYQNELKEKEIALLRKSQQLERAELQKQRTIKTAAFVLTGLLLVIGGLIVNRYRIIQRARRLAEVERLRHSIARDLHDEIGSTLSSIRINSRMALEHVSEEKMVTGQLQRINEYSGRLMESMTDIVWAISPFNDSLGNMIVRMKEFAVEMLEPQDIAIRFELPEKMDHVIPDVNRRKEMFMIFKEAINNCAKYSRCRNVTVTLVAAGSNLRLEVADDGNGFDTETARKGNGLRNMEIRAKAMGGKLAVAGIPGKGTTVALEM